jgi:hypothetical protein
MGRRHVSSRASLTASLLVVLSLFIGPRDHAAVTRATDAPVINEIDYNQPSTGTAGFIEIKNISGSSVNVDPYHVDLVNGTGGCATMWQISAGEPRILDYKGEYNPPYLYSPDAYRSSDHDPILVHIKQASRLHLPLIQRNHLDCVPAGEHASSLLGVPCCPGLSRMLLIGTCDTPGEGICDENGCTPPLPCGYYCSSCGNDMCEPQYRENRCNCPADCS